MRYIRETTGSRHVCGECKAKRDEKYVEQTGEVSRFALPMWRCIDGLCGQAWVRKHFGPGQIPAKLVQHGHSGLARMDKWRSDR